MQIGTSLPEVPPSGKSEIAPGLTLARVLINGTAPALDPTPASRRDEDIVGDVPTLD
jgi:hypothetical protein